MASVSSLGIGSGLDLNSILKQLIEAERGPTSNRLDLKEAETQASISAFGSFKSALAEFQSTLNDLKTLSEFQDRSTTSSDPDIFTASADSTASVGTTNINVLNLAAAHKLVSADFATPETVIGTGSLTIEAGGSSYNINIPDGSVSAIKDAINNSDAGTKVSANIITVDDGNGGTVSKLVISSKATGAGNAIEISVVDDDGTHDDAAGLSQLLFQPGNGNNRLTELDAATDARITVDGFTVSSATNEFKGAVEGVTITALKESEDPINNPPETLTVALNKTAIQGKVSSFVTVFNALKDTFNLLTDYDPNTGEAGLLNGDATIRTAERQLERILYGSINGVDGVYSNLSQLGITTGEKGKLSLDQETLNSALDSHFNDIGEFFAGDEGLAKQLADLTEGFLSATGIISLREEGFDTELKEIADDRVDLDRRLASIEARTRQQFAALDILLGQLNSTSEFLTQQLENTNRIVNGINSNK
ncbi:MAG: flagellar filament capping protein FliD [Pseudomonadales bacterium]|nr:flagellar filament capping protein FliD [Pseudomonadales bacterium]